MARRLAKQDAKGAVAGPETLQAAACAAEGKRDLIHKLGIALKELCESRSWIKLIVKADRLPESRMAPLLDEAQQVCNIVGKSVVTAQANQEPADA